MYQPDLKGFAQSFSLNHREVTTKHYVFMLKRFFSLCPAEPEKLTKKIFLNYCHENVRKGKISVLITETKKVLKQYFVFLNEEHAAKLDLSIFNIPVGTREFTPQPVLRFAEAKKIIEHLSERAKTFAQKRNCLLLLLYATTGMRKSEVLNIRMSDVNFKDNFINIWKTKTGQPRSVPIPLVTAEALKKYIEARNKIATQTDFLFVTYTGKKTTVATLTGVARKYLVKNNIKISFHAFRRGYASDLFETGCEAAYISRSLGHVSISTTFNYYVYVYDRTLKNEVSKHPAYFYEKEA